MGLKKFKTSTLTLNLRFCHVIKLFHWHTTVKYTINVQLTVYPTLSLLCTLLSFTQPIVRSGKDFIETITLVSG